MATQQQIRAAIVQHELNKANLQHEQATYEVRRDALVAKHAAQLEELELGYASLEARIARCDQEMEALQKALTNVQ